WTAAAPSASSMFNLGVLRQRSRPQKVPLNSSRHTVCAPGRRTVYLDAGQSFQRETLVMWFNFSRKTRSTDGNRSRRPTFRPTLETLEDRWVPSTLTVRNNLDSGAVSLRAEIAAARSNDTIVFAPSLVGQTITLTSGELLINKNLTIAGPGAGELTLSGNH